MAPISLADISITSATPGVLVKGTVDPYVPANGSLGIVDGSISANRMSDQIGTSYIVAGNTAFLSALYLAVPGSLQLGLHNTDSENGLVVAARNLLLLRLLIFMSFYFTIPPQRHGTVLYLMILIPKNHTSFLLSQ